MLYAEKIYQRAQDKRKHLRCTCGLVPHPHYRGTHALCAEHPLRFDSSREPMLQDMHDRLFNWQGRTAFA